MADTARAEKFRTALQQLEQTSDATDLLACFADEAELRRPELDHDSGGTPDAAQFWKTYRDQFSEVSSDFSRIVEAEDIAVLEWTSTAQLSAGHPVTYSGVSLLTFGDDDTITRFSTYYDTAAFVTPAS
jgi:ketosteroid isomerase-like protein